METKRISFNDEAVLDYCNLMGYHYYEEVPIQYLLSMLRKFETFKPFMGRNLKLKQIKSEFEQTERILTLENYTLELKHLDETLSGKSDSYCYQMKLFKKQKMIAKVVVEFSVSKEKA